MIIDIIVILKFYLIFLFNRIIPNGGVRIRYPCPITGTLCYNTDTLYITRYIILYII